MVHSSTDRMRWRTSLAVAALACQIGERIQHVGRVDLRDGPAADAREDVPLHAPDPVLRVPPATPAAVLLFEYALGGFGERRHSLYAAFLGEGIAARTGQHAVGESLLAGLGERDERGGAESEFAAPTADDEPLDPASDPPRLDEQVQAVAVRVASGRCGTDEGGREGLVGVASSALGSAGRGNGFGYNIQSPITCGIGLDSATCPDRTSPRRRIINYYVSVICGLDRMTSDAGGLPLGITAGRTRTGCSRCSGAARASTAGSWRWSQRGPCPPRCTGGHRPRS